ncbi:hypothetical protein Tco_0979130 [Tanacetum coccineum]
MKVTVKTERVKDLKDNVRIKSWSPSKRYYAQPYLCHSRSINRLLFSFSLEIIRLFLSTFTHSKLVVIENGGSLLQNIRVISFTMKMEILLEPTSNKLKVNPHGFEGIFKDGNGVDDFKKLKDHIHVKTKELAPNPKSELDFEDDPACSTIFALAESDVVLKFDQAWRPGLKGACAEAKDLEASPRQYKYKQGLTHKRYLGVGVG